MSRRALHRIIHREEEQEEEEDDDDEGGYHNPYLPTPATIPNCMAFKAALKAMTGLGRTMPNMFGPRPRPLYYFPRTRPPGLRSSFVRFPGPWSRPAPTQRLTPRTQVLT